MTECQIIPFRPKPKPVEMTHYEMELHYARRINGIIKAFEDAGFGPALDRVAAAWHMACAAQAADAPKGPPERKRPLFAVPNFDPPRNRARSPSRQTDRRVTPHRAEKQGPFQRWAAPQSR
jgi:hypothetical protein